MKQQKKQTKILKFYFIIGIYYIPVGGINPQQFTVLFQSQL